MRTHTLIRTRKKNYTLTRLYLGSSREPNVATYCRLHKFDDLVHHPPVGDLHNSVCYTREPKHLQFKKANRVARIRSVCLPFGLGINALVVTLVVDKHRLESKRTLETKIHFQASEVTEISNTCSGFLGHIRSLFCQAFGSSRLTRIFRILKLFRVHR
jgi:hypothetical protein